MCISGFHKESHDFSALFSSGHNSKWNVRVGCGNSADTGNVTARVSAEESLS